MHGVTFEMRILSKLEGSGSPDCNHCAGGGRYRLKMNGFTWDPSLQSIVKFAPGTLMALEQGGRGGFEMRSNVGVTCEPGQSIPVTAMSAACRPCEWQITTVASTVCRARACCCSVWPRRLLVTLYIPQPPTLC